MINLDRETRDKARVLIDIESLCQSETLYQVFDWPQIIDPFTKKPMTSALKPHQLLFINGKQSNQYDIENSMEFYSSSFPSLDTLTGPPLHLLDHATHAVHVDQ